MTVPHYIKNHQAVINHFGGWPTFHDASVLAYALDAQGESLTFTLHAWLMTNEVDAEGFFVLRNHARVSFRFSGIGDLDMDAFRADNILFALEFSPTGDPGAFQVMLDSVMDMSGSFSARSGEVLSVIPCSSNGELDG